MHTNLHTHTHFCGHASGTAREYIENAIAGGIKTLGFSEHAPFVCDDGTEHGYRLKMENAEEYFSTLCALRDEYRDKIEIHIGFETEYYPNHFQKMLRTFVDLGAEFLLLGNHNSYGFGSGKNGNFGSPDNGKDAVYEYEYCVCEAIKSGQFTYIAHPDILRYSGGIDKTMIGCFENICECAKQNDLPLEINFLGIRDHRTYPIDTFWQIAGEIGCPVVFGFDAHDAASAYDAASLKVAEGLVEKYGLRLVEDIKIVTPHI